MDALILSCGTGGGHNSAGRAIKQELHKRGHNAVMLNPYTLKSERLAGGIDNSYISTVQAAPRVFGVVYHLGNAYRNLPFRSPVYFVNGAMVTAVEKYLSENRFDVVVMPHLYPAEIMTNMKARGIPVPKTVFVATDYVCTPFTEETDCDAYVIPASDLASDFIDRGVAAQKLYPLGIPVDSKFCEDMTKQEARKALGLGEDKKYILLTGGSMGGGKIERVIECLLTCIKNSPHTELIVICGSNARLYEKLKEQNEPKLIPVGNTDKMALYLKAGDLFISKPGGLSSTEAAVSGIPLLHTSAIPGCESYNAKYFSKKGMSVSCQKATEARRLLQELLTDEKKHEQMMACQARYINKNAAADICDLLERLAEKTPVSALE